MRAHLVFVCPRYEGVDERIRALVDLELSIGDYVVTGGELPALVVIDAVIRLLPGAIDDASTAEESFSAGLLEYPQYTRPPSFRGMDVPAILTSGDHGAVARWRAEQASARTRERRPDLLPPSDGGWRWSDGRGIAARSRGAGRAPAPRARMQRTRWTSSTSVSSDLQAATGLVRRRGTHGRGASPGERALSILDHEAAVRRGRRLVRSRRWPHREATTASEARPS